MFKISHRISRENVSLFYPVEMAQIQLWKLWQIMYILYNYQMKVLSRNSCCNKNVGDFVSTLVKVYHMSSLNKISMEIKKFYQKKIINFETLVSQQDRLKQNFI